MMAVNSRVGRILWGVGALLAAAGAGYFAADYREQKSRKTFSEIPLPPAEASSTGRLFALTLTDVSGKPQPLGQWQGKILVVNFWATWCAPCREEIPAFSRLHSKFASKNVQFVGIAIDSTEKVSEFSRQTPFAYPSLIASQTPAHLMAELGNPSGGVPFTTIIGPDGRMVRSRLGLWQEDALEALLGELTR